MQYKKDLEIDIHDLDQEVIKQPVLFDHYSQELVPLYKLQEELKIALDQTAARLDGIIRESAAAEGIKTTETKISNEIKLNPEYINIQDRYLKISTEIKEKEIIKEAFRQRKDMLRHIVELYIAGYWAHAETPLIRDKRSESLKNLLEQKIKEEKQPTKGEE